MSDSNRHVQTERVLVDPANPDRALIRRAAQLLRAGGLVAFPTETVYGLGANALDAQAVARIFAAKGRPPTNPLIVHVADVHGARSLASDWQPAADRLAARFWPGPLTLVLGKGSQVSDLVTAGGKTIALRVPAHPVALALVQEAGVPIAAPSANRSSAISPTCADHVAKGLGGRIEMILDAGPAPGGLESTVLDLTSQPPRLLRPGLVTRDELQKVLGAAIGDGPVLVAEGQGLPSPGLAPRHYAPRVPLECLAEGDSNRVAELLAGGVRVGWMPLDAGVGAEHHPKLTAIMMPSEPRAYAARLYAALHALEEANVERIVAALPPDSPRWAAVRDRLARASAKA